MHVAPTTCASHRTPDTTVAGTILLVVTLIEIVAMAHHPTLGTADIGTAIQRIGELSRLAGQVHGVLIAALLLTFYGLTAFALRLGVARPLIRAGVIAHGAGTLVMVGAALISGFVLADVASISPHDTAIDLQIDRHVLILCGILNQACADFGVVAMSTGIALWSIDLLRDRGNARRIGTLGCVAGVAPCAALLAGAVRLDVHGMSVVVAIQAAWTLAIGAWLLQPTGMHATPAFGASPAMR